MMEQRTKNTPTEGAPSAPLASVVVNNYNYARFLREAIDSALAQTYTPLEVVVVDDGSTDESRALIESYGDRVIPVMKENGGMASALNAGFRASRGDVIVFLDSDDALLPTAVTAAVDVLRDPQVVKAHWPLREIDEEGRDTGSLVPARILPEGVVRDLVIEKGPMSGNGPPTSGNAWSRRFLDQVLPMPEEELKQHADAYLNTLACLFGALGRVSEPQGRYRVHGGNDYASEPLVERLRRNLRMYHYRCRLLSSRLRASGVDVHPAAWKTTSPSHYQHLERRFRVLQQIASLIPPGGKFILVDNGAFGSGKLIADLRSVRFPADGTNRGGFPPNDEAAIEQLERMRAEGADFVVFVKPAQWLKRYEGLRRHLESRYSCELATDDSVAFNLRP
jgi:glycosyltransferase involved in cell wall biosynthesis